MEARLSLCQLMEPEVMTSPYGLYRELRETDPVHWDAFLHAWVVTRYSDVVTVLSRFSADRTLTKERLEVDGARSVEPDFRSHVAADVVSGPARAHAPEKPLRRRL